MKHLILAGPSLGLALTAVAACGNGNAPSTDDSQALSSMILETAAIPASPTNAYADDDNAAALGRHLFFDTAMSADGKISCASCHDPQKGFSDPRPVSKGVADRAGTMHSMPATAVAYHPFLFWDGRADSVRSQPLKAIEGTQEMSFTRVEVAHFIGDQYRTIYENVFGALPELDALTAKGAPGMPEWDSLSALQQDQVNRVFANVGKAIEAYERKLSCSDTRFDQYMRGEITLTATETAGAAGFVEDGCTRCHTGPSFSDGKFHNLGIGDGSNPGRADGLVKLFADPFNGAGAYSDDVAAGRSLLSKAALETATKGAFRTASLRGAGQRATFGHLGDRASLHQFINDIYNRGGRGRNVQNLDPLLNGVNPGNIDELVAFIHTLDCRAVPADLLAP